MNLKKINKILIVAVAAIFLTLIGYFYQNKAFHIHFVDEEDNLVLGKYLLDGRILYKDLFSHHQPLAYVLSAQVQKVTNPNSIYLLIKRNREAIIAWSFFWGVLLVVRFGRPLLGFIIFYETTKLYLLGNQFLSESLVVYPLVFLSTLAITHIKNRNEYFIAGILTGICAFLLSPIWPLLLFLAILMIYQSKKRLESFVILTLGMLPVFIAVLPFISLKEYLFHTFYINLFYYIPITSSGNFLGNTFKAFLMPMISFFIAPQEYPLIHFIRFYSIILIGLTIYLFIRKRFKLIAVVFVLIGLANIRYVSPDQQFYRGFHLLPWYSLLILVIFLLIDQMNKLKHRILATVFLLFTGLLIFLSKEDVFLKRDMDNDFFINFSRQFTIGEAVRIAKDTQKDTLFIAPDEWLTYWQADITPASRMINYYAWMNKVPFLRAEAENTLAIKKPTFVYLNQKGTGFETYLNDYVNLKKDGKETGLYVKKEKIESLTAKQKGDLNYHNFELE